MSAGIIFLLILALLLVIFTLQNTMLITLKLFFWEISDVPLVLALILIFTAGIIVSLVIQYPRTRKLRKKIRELKRKLEEEDPEDMTSISGPDDIPIDDSSKNGFFND